MTQSPAHAQGAVFYPQRGRGTCQNSQGDKIRYLLPTIPFMKIYSAIATHQEDEFSSCKRTSEGVDRIKAAVGAQMVLDICCQHVRLISKQSPAGRKPIKERGVIFFFFERVMRGNQPPDDVQFKHSQGNAADMQMPFMRGVERAT